MHFVFESHKVEENRIQFFEPDEKSDFPSFNLNSYYRSPANSVPAKIDDEEDDIIQYTVLSTLVQ